jgi:hypothetical protein
MSEDEMDSEDFFEREPSKAEKQEVRFPERERMKHETPRPRT